MMMHLRRRAAYVLLGLSLYVAAEDPVSSFKAEILYPSHLTLTAYQDDSIIVLYKSEIPDNSLYTWCWDGEKGPTLKAKIRDAVAYNGEELVTINYTSSDNCWFNLRSRENPDDIGWNSGWFKVASGKRATASTFSLGASTTSSSVSSSSATSSSSSEVTSSPSTASSGSESSPTTRSERTGETTLGGPLESASLSTSTLVSSMSASSAAATTTASGGSKDDSAASGDSSASSGDGLVTAARIGLGVGIAMGATGITALAVAIWMVRRRNTVVKPAETNSGSEELQGDVPKRPWWRTDIREMASNEELRRGPQHEMTG
ncbi:unnamed protein product [Clonostachys byssicola]|uniref:Mid2 domain-containing protein n=1 Tax=Clonostachys byssicola TaxID=160290 RepID=A0A9N9UZF2_9HYPO|nr:unnamed protein product [Clonostachys byssicola]